MTGIPDMTTTNWLQIVGFLVTTVSIVATLRQQMKAAEKRHEALKAESDARHTENTGNFNKIQAESKEDRGKIWGRMDEMVETQNKTSNLLNQTASMMVSFTKLEDERHLKLDLEVKALKDEATLKGQLQTQTFGQLSAMSENLKHVANDITALRNRGNA